jgi:hypothetical protein
MHRPQLYRLQYQKKLWGNLKKFGRKKMFSLKSMTKLEDLIRIFPTPEAVVLDDFQPKTTDYLWFCLAYTEVFQRWFIFIVLNILGKTTWSFLQNCALSRFFLIQYSATPFGYTPQESHKNKNKSARKSIPPKCL